MVPIRLKGPFIVEIVIRIILFLSFRITDEAIPFHRKIHPEEMWLYRNPRTESYVPTHLLWVIVLGCPIVAFGSSYFIRRNITDVVEATLGISLSIWLTGTVTNCIKLGVGRPRPDFFWRCFPDGHYNEDMDCTGDVDVVNEGMKSFPSGHAALSFSSLMFVFLYLVGKLHCFTAGGRGQAWRLCLSLSPLLTATMVAVSRTADYHHHWQDVTIGSLLGICIGYMCYRQYYPAVNKTNSHLAYVEITPGRGYVIPELEAIRSPQLSPPVPSTHVDFIPDLKDI